MKERVIIPGQTDVVKFVTASAREVNDPVFGNSESYSAVPAKPKRNQQDVKQQGVQR